MTSTHDEVSNSSRRSSARPRWSVRNSEPDEEASQTVEQPGQQTENFKKAFSICLEAQKYIVENLAKVDITAAC
jgi:hypothetical protein